MSDSLTDTTLQLLNRFLEADREACLDLMTKKVAVNDAVANDKDLVCRERKKVTGHELGILGLINGILNATGSSRVAVMTDHDGEIVGFSKYKVPVAAPPAPPAPPSSK